MHRIPLGRLAAALAALLTLVLVASACTSALSGGDDSAGGDGAPPGGGGDVVATTTTVEPARDIGIELNESSLAPGTTLSISGEGCPPDPEWELDDLNFKILLRLAPAGDDRGQKVDEPERREHLSTGELDALAREPGAQLASAGERGLWSADYEVPASTGPGEYVLLADCYSGLGLEWGSVRYGSAEVTVVGETSGGASTTTG